MYVIMIFIHQTRQLAHSYVYPFIISCLFPNQPETPYRIIQDYSSQQLRSLMLENTTWNSLNDYPKSLRVID